MPIKKSAKKYIKVTKKNTALNKEKKLAFRNSIKKLLVLIKEGKKSEAQKEFVTTQKALDKAAKTNIITKNTAARKKSRLAKKIKEMK
jgi:small subunit ribosomal protein S20